MKTTKGQPQEHLRLNASSLSKYQEVKDVVVTCISTKQTLSKDRTRDPDAMEIGMVSKGTGKRTGKSKGKSGQDVASFKCGGQVHMASQRPSSSLQDKGRGA